MNHEQLKQALEDYALIAFKDNEIFLSSKQRGIAPLVALCDMNRAGDALFAADKVIGKAASLLCAHCGVKVLYAKVISEAACAVLKRYDIEVEYDMKVPYIKNRTGSGKCPMEKLAKNVQEPAEMLIRAKSFLKSLNP